MQAMDVDMDGDQDLFGHFDGVGFQWAENTDGQGTLATFELLVDAAGVSDHAVADLNGDGAPDLVYLNAEGIHVAINETGGVFGAAQLAQPILVATGAIALADVSGNGWPDVITTISTGGISRIAVLPNVNGTFGTQYLLPPMIEGDPPTVLLAGDLTGNDGADVFYVDPNDAAIGLMNVNGDGSEWQQTTLFNLFNYPLIEPILIDVDGDGDLDIAEATGTVIQWAENRINENIPFNAFTVRNIEPNLTAGHGAFSDLGCSAGVSVVYVPSNPQLPVRWRTYLPATLRFSPTQEIVGVPRGSMLVLADMNGDGKNDLIIGNSDGLYLFNNEIDPPTTIIELPALDTVCVAGPSIALPEGMPAGGTWTGTWVSGNVFHRSSVGGTATVPLAYTWQEPEGCPVGENTTIRVIAGPTIQPFLGSFVCSGDGPFQMSSAPQATEWSGLSDGNILDLDEYAGEQIVAVYTDPTGSTCVSFMGPLNVWNTVPAAILPAGPFCITDEVQTIVPEVQWGNNNWAGAITGTEGGNALFDPSQGAGEYTISLSRNPTGPQQCANSDSITIVVSDDIPQIALEQPAPYCASTSSIPLNELADPVGGVWSGPGVSNNVMLPFIAGPGTHEITYVYEDPEGGCRAIEQTTITLSSTVVVTHDGGGMGSSFCLEGDPVTFTATPVGGEWSAPVQPDGTFDPAQAGVGDHALVYVYTDPNGCMLVNPPTTLTVNEEPTAVSIDPVGAQCLNGGLVELTGSHAGIWSGAVSGEGSSVLFDPMAVGVGTWSVSLTAEEEGFCPTTNTIDVVVEICVGVEYLAGQAFLSISPNPTAGLSMIHVGGMEAARILVLDAAGRTVLELPELAVGTTHVPLDLTSLANGIYHLRVIHAGEVMQLKVMKTD